MAKYSKKMPKAAEALARQGKTDQEIADELGVARSTLSRYKDLYPEFKEALERGKADADDKVEASLFKRALGYDYDETKVITDENGRPVKFEKIKKHMPPDTTAQIFWLKNRRRTEWRDKWDVDINTEKEIVLNIMPASEMGEKEEEE